MAQTNKETEKNNYNIDSIKANANTGTLVGTGQANLKDYGIDYNEDTRNQIASIFEKQATSAYGTAQNEYANNMAQQQASLRDTIRRSQAQAVATGASRGMQAANELSNMLGLQEEAAKGATEMHGNYAAALAQAQQQAMEMQNARAQTGAQVAAADIAGEAQKYSVNMDYQANDPYRVISEMAALRASGDNAAADALLTGWLASQGVSDSRITNNLNAVGANSDPSTWAGQISYSGLTKNSQLENNFKVNVDGTKYKVELGKYSSELTKEGSIASQVPRGAIFILNGQLYIKQGDGDVREVRGRVDDSKGGDYGGLYRAIQNKGFILSTPKS